MMDPLRIKRKNDPEAQLQLKIRLFLEARFWYVKATHSGLLQAGFPDLYVTHKIHGARWIEVKLPEMKGSRWTNAQREVFPLLVENGSPIWILTRATEQEYRLLFDCPHGNYLQYVLLKN